MAKLDPEIAAHLEWIDFVRPTGLVVSAPALVRAGAILDRRDAEGQRLMRACAAERVFPGEKEPTPWLPDFQLFAASVLEWSFSPGAYAGTAENPVPPEIELPLPDYNETLRPDFAVRELEPQNGRQPWQLFVRVVEPGQDFDAVVRGVGQLEASAHGRMERLLRRTGVAAGLLFNGRVLRLVSAPHGESSGWLDFRVADMLQTAGRPISTALRLLLRERTLLSLPRPRRLAALLEDSRKFQNEVSERLAEQVLHALYELLRGFQSAHDLSGNALLRRPLADHPDDVYRALLTVILRLVFVLYAEERDMLPEDETFLRHYSLSGLYDRLREDAAQFPDTLDQRYGAWAQLLVLFRMVFDGAETGAMRLPRRHGVLFDPDRFKFLEGRSEGGARQIAERIESPKVPDGTIYRALEKLLVLDGERISYRALDVEQIGSVYETMMGFRLQTASGRSVAIKPQKKRGAPTAVDLEALLSQPPERRDKWIADRTDRKLTDTLKKAVRAARRLEDLHAALVPVIDLAATPDLVPKGAMVLQPSEERRRSGSHYTPRALTEPIVRTTLAPVLKRLRGHENHIPRPAEILDLKLCDPAMGSGAFLVEACRQLGDALVDAWASHGDRPPIPPDEDEVVFARRLVALRCIYGVDRNPVAVDLAKMSLWLVTLARDHALTFVDHALRHGDSLVGLSRRQIEALNTDPSKPMLVGLGIHEALNRVAELRTRIRESGDQVSDWELRDLWDQAQFELAKVRLFGDLVLAAFFEGDKPKDREQRRRAYANAIINGEAGQHRERLDARRDGEQPFAPFHWEVELPEVFGRGNGGFDAIIGNPPYVNAVALDEGTDAAARKAYFKAVYQSASGSFDLYILFLEQSLNLLRQEGSVGLLVPNKLLGAEYALEIRRVICRRARVEALLDLAAGELFEASVYPIVLVVTTPHRNDPAQVELPGGIRRTVPQSTFRDAPGMLWGFAMTEYSDLLSACFERTRALGALAEVCGAATVSEAYEIAEFIRSSDGTVPPRHAKFVVSGNVRAGHSTWSDAPVRYLKQTYEKPIVRLDRLPPMRASQARTSKIIISGMARRPTAFVDTRGEYLAGKSTVLVLNPSGKWSLSDISDVLNSKIGALIYRGMFMGLELGGGYMRYGPPQLKMFPIPEEKPPHGQGPLDDATVCRLYGVPEQAVQSAFARCSGALVETPQGEDLADDIDNSE